MNTEVHLSRYQKLKLDPVKLMILREKQRKRRRELKKIKDAEFIKGVLERGKKFLNL